MVLLTHRLLMCVVTAFRLTKNEYNSDAEKAFVECLQIG